MVEVLLKGVVTFDDFAVNFGVVLAVGVGSGFGALVLSAGEFGLGAAGFSVAVGFGVAVTLGSADCLGTGVCSGVGAGALSVGFGVGCVVGSGAGTSVLTAVGNLVLPIASLSSSDSTLGAAEFSSGASAASATAGSTVSSSASSAPSTLEVGAAFAGLLIPAKITAVAKVMARYLRMVLHLSSNLCELIRKNYKGVLPNLDKISIAPI